MKILVDGSIDFKSLIQLASHQSGTPFLFANGLEEKYFPFTDRTKREIDVKLLKFPKKDRYNIVGLIEEKGFRSLFIEELLFLSYLFPHKQVQYTIAALSNYKFGNHGKLYPCLSNQIFFGRQVGTMYIDSDVDYQNLRFAVTKKSNKT